MKKLIPLAIFAIAAAILLALVFLHPENKPAVYEDATMVMTFNAR